MPTEEWFLTAAERGNNATDLDRRHPGSAWTAGNAARPLIHGAEYFAELVRRVDAMREGDLLLFTDWRGDPDEIVERRTGRTVSALLCEAARRGVNVKGLIWRSHWDKLAFSAEENRHLGADIEAAGGECLLDMRVRTGGSHHQKFVVLRHPGRPELDVAFVGGIDLCHSRHDDSEHGGDPQSQPMATEYGPTPPWHDAQLELRGPAVGDVEVVFRERWCDPTPLARSPFYRLGEIVHRDDRVAAALPEQLPDPAPVGTADVQLLRTYAYRRRGYPFAPGGERSVARGYDKVIAQAQHLIYVEDQYFWAAPIVQCFADALAAQPDLRLILVIPRFPDQGGPLTRPPNLVGRQDALDLVFAAGGDRVAVYSPENQAGVPVYVHAKVCVVDDVWASIGSDNVNRRSWTHDSELTCAVLDQEVIPGDGDTGDHGGARRFARDLRLRLAAEHLDRAEHDVVDLADPAAAFAAFRQSAARLQQWYDGGRVGARPPGRLRVCERPDLPRATRVWARPFYRTVYDPDGRPRGLRRGDRF